MPRRIVCADAATTTTSIDGEPMGLFVVCDCCDCVVFKGAILLSPPRERMVEKFHLCDGCFRHVLDHVASYEHPTHPDDD